MKRFPWGYKNIDFLVSSLYLGPNSHKKILVSNIQWDFENMGFQT
jgi:hypothetical protein